MPRTRIMLSGLVALGLALAACGGDDSEASTDDETTTTEADDTSTADTTADTTDDEAIDVCALVDLELVNAETGEDFSITEQTEADTCQVTNEADTALLQVSVRPLEADETEESFIADGLEACDTGTELTDVDFSYAAAGFACEISGEAALAVTLDGGALLLIGHPSDDMVTTEQITGALNNIAAAILSS